MVPRVSFRGQPGDAANAAGEFLRRALNDPNIDELTVVVAWARFRGLARLRSELVAFKERGSSRIIVGIDEGGATGPGLHAAIRWFSAAYVFHDRSGGTFHPKIYLAEGASKALLLVGSSNATPGGFFFNHEASLEAEFDLPEDSDSEALFGVRDYISRLLEDTDVCLQLDEELIERLVADRRYRVSGNERRSRPVPTPPPEGAEEADVEEGGEEPSDGDDAPIFGSSRHARPRVPGLSEEARTELAGLETDDEAEELPASGAPPAQPPAPPAPPAAAPPPASPSPAPGPPTVVATWSKPMSRADAQQPASAGTNPTGLLRLAKAGHDIDHRTWFRQTLFGSVPWSPQVDREGNPIEVASVPFVVTINGASVGTFNLLVDHAPHREEQQDNVTTILHWGREMGAILRGTSYYQKTVTISRLSDGTYRLDIS